MKTDTKFKIGVSVKFWSINCSFITQTNKRALVTYKNIIHNLFCIFTHITEKRKTNKRDQGKKYLIFLPYTNFILHKFLILNTL